MSIFYCTKCDQHRDSDIDEGELINDEIHCESCADAYHLEKDGAAA